MVRQCKEKESENLFVSELHLDCRPSKSCDNVESMRLLQKITTSNRQDLTEICIFHSSLEAE